MKKYTSFFLSAKTVLIVFVGSLLLHSCKKNEIVPPEFKSIIHLEMQDISKKSFDLTSSIVFANNGNDDFVLVKTIADVMIDGADVATFLYRKPSTLNSGTELSIPLSVTLDQNDLKKMDGAEMLVLCNIKGHSEFLSKDDNKKIIVPFKHEQKMLVKNKSKTKEVIKTKRKEKKRKVKTATEDAE
jgi:hypothetical protein